MNLMGVDKWYDDILLEVPGAPKPLVKHRIIMATAEVCKRTMISNATLDPVEIEDGVSIYRLETPSSCLRIWRVLWVKSQGRILTQAARRNLISENKDWEQDTGEAAYSFINIDASTIQLIPGPTKAIEDGFTAHVAFVPDPRTPRIDDRFFYYYKEAIVAGTLAKLLRIKNMAWYDRAAATDREIEFQVEISKINANTNKDESVADLKVALRKFW